MSELLNDMRARISTTIDRIDSIMSIITEYSGGKDPSSLKARFDNELESITAGELAYAKQLMSKLVISGNKPHQGTEKLIDLFNSNLKASNPIGLTSGHPIHNYMAENREIMKLAQNLLGPRTDLAETYEQLIKVNMHYTRKENYLFPYFEQYGFDNPNQVMWTTHDEIRKSTKMCQFLFNSGNLEDLAEVEPIMLRALQKMISEEELVLFPTALEMFSVDDWTEISAAEGEIGFCFIKIPEPWKPAVE